MVLSSLKINSQANVSLDWAAITKSIKREMEKWREYSIKLNLIDIIHPTRYHKYRQVGFSFKVETEKRLLATCTASWEFVAFFGQQFYAALQHLVEYDECKQCSLLLGSQHFGHVSHLAEYQKNWKWATTSATSTIRERKRQWDSEIDIERETGREFIVKAKAYHLVIIKQLLISQMWPPKNERKKQWIKVPHLGTLIK